MRTTAMLRRERATWLHPFRVNPAGHLAWLCL